MKILIGLSTGETLRKAEFLPHFVAMQRPENSLQIIVSGQSPAKARNMIIDAAIQNECTHIFFLDDDMIVEQDTLMRLIAHNKTIVSALYLLRTFPHHAAAFDRAYTTGLCKYISLTNEKTGLIPGVNAGLGCVLIETEVFKNLDKPYVRLGEIESDGWCDDIGFFNRVRRAGYIVWIDLDIRVGHLTTVQLWPARDENGEWFTQYKHMEGAANVPRHIPTEDRLKEQEKKLGGLVEADYSTENLDKINKDIEKEFSVSE